MKTISLVMLMCLLLVLGPCAAITGLAQEADFIAKEVVVPSEPLPGPTAAFVEKLTAAEALSDLQIDRRRLAEEVGNHLAHVIAHSPEAGVSLMARALELVQPPDADAAERLAVSVAFTASAMDGWLAWRAKQGIHDGEADPRAELSADPWTKQVYACREIAFQLQLAADNRTSAPYCLNGGLRQQLRRDVQNILRFRVRRWFETSRQLVQVQGNLADVLARVLGARPDAWLDLVWAQACRDRRIPSFAAVPGYGMMKPGDLAGGPIVARRIDAFQANKQEDEKQQMIYGHLQSFVQDPEYTPAHRLALIGAVMEADTPPAELTLASMRLLASVLDEPRYLTCAPAILQAFADGEQTAEWTEVANATLPLCTTAVGTSSGQIPAGEGLDMAHTLLRIHLARNDRAQADKLCTDCAPLLAQCGDTMALLLSHGHADLVQTIRSRRQRAIDYELHPIRSEFYSPQLHTQLQEFLTTLPETDRYPFWAAVATLPDRPVGEGAVAAVPPAPTRDDRLVDLARSFAQFPPNDPTGHEQLLALLVESTAAAEVLAQQLDAATKSLDHHTYLTPGNRAVSFDEAVGRRQQRLIYAQVSAEFRRRDFVTPLARLEDALAYRAACDFELHAFIETVNAAFVQAATHDIQHWTAEQMWQAAQLSQTLVINRLSHSFDCHSNIGLHVYLHNASGHSADLFEWNKKEVNNHRNREMIELNTSEYAEWMQRQLAEKGPARQAEQIRIAGEYVKTMQNLDGVLISDGVVLATNRYGSTELLKPLVEQNAISDDELPAVCEKLVDLVDPPDLVWSALADRQWSQEDRDAALKSLARAITMPVRNATDGERRKVWLAKKRIWEIDAESR